MAYTVNSINGLRVSARRCVVFLTDETGALDAWEVFCSLDPGSKTERTVRDRLDLWINFGHKKEWFHGWDVPEFRECFVFKWPFRNVGQRFYGFLCHPQPAVRASFQLCVLHTHDMKSEQATEKGHLRLANRLRVEPSVKAAIQMHFPDTKPGEKQWTN